jgi:restriction system protein
MPRTSYWILLTANHISETYIPPEGDRWTYEISPVDGIKRDDVVYLWSNVTHAFFGWGTILEPPKLIVEPEPLNRRRHSVAVRREKEFYPGISEQAMQRHPRLRKIIPSGFDDLYALPLQKVQANDLNDFVRENRLDAPQGSATVQWSVLENAPDITVQAILTYGDKTNEGRLIEGVGIAWDEIIKLLTDSPDEIHNFDPHKLEELIAGAYVRAGYEVELTPRSGDKGRDVVATKHGIGSIRIFDQIKRYKITRPVSADEVRALVGVITMAPNVSKGVITTTSTFAPRLLDDKDIARLVPYRLELKPKNVLLPWLQSLRRF